MSDALLSFLGVNLISPHGEQVLTGLSWDLPKASRIALQALTGGGASCLLRMATGLLHPTSGQVNLDGVVHHPGRFEHPFLARGGVGWVPTEGGLLVNQTLLANTALPLRFVKGMTRASAEVVASEWLEAAGLLDLAQRRPHAVDPRDRWLTGLCRSGASGAPLLLLDRPPAPLEGADLARATALLGRLFTLPVTALVVDPPPAWNHFFTGRVHLDDGRLLPGDLP